MPRRRPGDLQCPEEDQVTYNAQQIEDGFQGKQHILTAWLDVEKAHDKVWKDGLSLEFRKSDVTGCIYQRISQYLTNMKARVHVKTTYNRKKTLREEVPQGGVLSPTLFLAFINDSVGDLPVDRSTSHLHVKSVLKA